MKATFGLPIFALVGLVGCATESTNVATTTTRQVTSQPPERILIQEHPIPKEQWAAKSALVGKDSP